MHTVISAAHRLYRQVQELLETGIMTDPPLRQLPPEIPAEPDAPTDLQTPNDEPPADTPATEEEKQA